MNTNILLICVLLCLVTVNGRHFADGSDTEELSDDREDRPDLTHVRRAREHGASQMRHRRKRWPMNGYDYPQPHHSYNPEYRRDDRQQDLLPHILRLLDEISDYVKRPPPPPPQPIYVPYPVIYPVPRPCRCRSKDNMFLPNITDRIFPDDPNRNWGLDEPEEIYDEGDGDGSRPVNFDPVPPRRTTKRPPPKVDHGSSQAGRETTTKNPLSQKRPESKPLICDAAVLSCCNLGGQDQEQKQKECFGRMGCSYSPINCTPASISAAIQRFSETYSPITVD